MLVSFIIRAGILALITLIASPAVSATALTQEVKRDAFINHFAKNIIF